MQIRYDAEKHQIYSKNEARMKLTLWRESQLFSALFICGELVTCRSYHLKLEL